MKHIVRIMLSIVIMLMSNFVFGQTNSLPGDNTSIPERNVIIDAASESIQEPFLMEINKTICYLIYLDSDLLKITLSRDGGKSFNAYSLDSAFQGKLFPAPAHARALTSYQQDTNDWNCFFIGTDIYGNEGIYRIGFDTGGEIAVTCFDYTTEGSIDRYEILPGIDGAFSLLSLKNGLLLWRHFTTEGGPASVMEVQTPGEWVTDFTLNIEPDPAGISYYGAYICREIDQTIKAVSFECSGDVITYVPVAAFGQIRETFALYTITRKHDLTSLLFAVDGVIHTTVLRQGTWDIPVQQELPDPGTIEDIATVETRKGLAAAWILNTKGLRNIYTMTLNNGITEFSQPINSRPVDGGLQSISYADGSMLIAWAEESDNGKTIRVSAFDNAGRWQPLFFPGLSPINSRELISFSLFRNSRGETLMETIFTGDPQKENKTYWSLYELLPFSGMDCSIRNKTEKILPGITQQESRGKGAFGKEWTDYVTMEVGGVIYGMNLLSGTTGEVQYPGNIAVSSNVPDSYALSANADFLVLQKIGPSNPPPAGAMWTFGTPLHSSNGYVRLYCRQGKTTGTYEVEVQQENTYSYVSTAGDVLGGSGDYMCTREYPVDREGEFNRDFVIDIFRGKTHYIYLISCSGEQGSREPVKTDILEFSGVTMDTTLSDGLSRTMIEEPGGYLINQLTNNSFDEENFRISGNRIVWNVYDGHDYEIYYWPGNGDVQQLTNNEYDDYYPQISGNNVVWHGFDGNDYEIYYWPGSGDVRQLTNNEYHESSPQISGNHVVWSRSDGHDSEIYYWPGSGTVQQLTNNEYNDHSPQISGSWIVWYGSGGNDNDTEIYYWPGSGDVQQLTNNEYDDYSPQISGNHVVWYGYDGNDYEIYYWPGSGAVQQLTNNEYYDYSLHISGNHVVWSRYDGNDFEIYYWPGSGGVQIITDNEYNDNYPQISGNRVVWNTYDGNDVEIYYWPGNEDILQLTDNEYYDYYPQISENRIVWRGYDGNDYEIYFIDLATTPPEIQLSLTDTGGIPVLADTWINNYSVTVNAEITDTGSGIASVIYQTLGAQMSSGTGSSVQIINQGRTVVTFSATDYTGNTTSASATILLDRTPPVITLTRTPGGTGWITSGTATLSGSASDSNGSLEVSGLAGQWQYVVNGGERQNGNSYSTAGEGIFDITFFISDRAGNEAHETGVISIDKTAPYIILPSILTRNTNLEPRWTSAAALFQNTSLSGVDTGSGLNAGSWQYRTETDSAGTWHAFNAATGIDISEIEHYSTANPFSIYLRVRDNAGNWGESDEGVIRIDHRGPDITQPPEALVWNNEIAFFPPASGVPGAGVKATDNGGSGVDDITWEWLDGSVWKNAAAFVSTEGERQFSVRVRDQLGNYSPVKTVIQRYDRTAPDIAVTLTGAVNGVWTNAAAVSLRAVISERNGGSGIASTWYRINGIRTEFSASPEILFPDNGTYSVYFYARDNAGNQTQSGEQVVRIDRSPPVITDTQFASPAGIVPGVYYNYPEIRVLATATDPHSGIKGNTWAYSFDKSVWHPFDPGEGGVPITVEGRTIVYFRVSDNAGNRTSSTDPEQITVLLDRNGPVITCNTAEFAVNQFPGHTLGIQNLGAGDPLAGMGPDPGWMYSVDNQSPVSFVPGVAETILNLQPTGWESPDEGDHSLIISAVDILGNPGELSVGFVVDHTQPVISAVTVKDALGNTVPDGGYSLSRDVTIEITASDRYAATNGFSPGEIDYYQYVSSGSSILQNPSFDALPKITSSHFTVNGLLQRANYLYFHAVDKAGNKSPVREVVILFDDALPPAPEIIGLTHPRAQGITDAVPFTEARFRLSQGASTPSGIRAFSYTLKKGTEVTSHDTIPAEESNILVFDMLDDNDNDEFYILEVAAIAGNGRTGSAASYQFRVDSTPPVNLTVYALPQRNPGVLYGASRVEFSWMRPVDMTGIKSYYYLITESHLELPVTEKEAAALSLTDWTPTSSEELSFKIRGIFGKEEGIIYFYLCAEDYAGNRQFDRTSFQYDLAPPRLSSLSETGQVFIRVDTSEAIRRRATVEWGIPLDNKGPVRTFIQLFKIENGLTLLGGRISGDPNTRSYTFEGLDPDCAGYVVIVTVEDAAGNSNSYNAVFTVGTSPVPVDISIPFSFSIDGYRIYGTRALVSGLARGFLEVPVGLALHEDNEAKTSIVLDKLYFDESGNFISARCPESRIFRFSSGGFTFNASGLIFDAENGLVFSQVMYTKEVGVDGVHVAQTFFYSDFLINFPPSLSIAGCTTDTAPRFSLETEPDSWSIDNITQTSFSGKEWVLLAGNLDTSELHTQYGIDVYQHIDGVQTYSLEITDTGINAESEITEGGINTPFYLESGDALFRVGKAVVRGNKIVILESLLLLPQGYTPGEVSICNFTIDNHGNFEAAIDYHAGDFTFIDENGNIFHITELAWDGKYLIGNGISLTTPGGKVYTAQGLHIGSEGVLWDMDVEVDGLCSFSIHGYTIESDTAVLTQQGVLLKTATIPSFPLAFGGGSKTLSSLGIRLQDSSVYNPGVSDTPFTFVPPEYKGSVVVKGLRMDEAGLFGEEIDVSLPACMDNHIIPFTDFPLYADSTTGIAKPINGTIDFSFHGFSCRSENLVFDGVVIAFSEGSLILPPGSYPEELSFATLLAGGEGVRSADLTTGSIDYFVDGWNFIISEPVLDEEGMWGIATLFVSSLIETQEVVFPHFRLESGGYQAGMAETSSFLVLGGFPALLDGIEFINGELRAQSANVSLYSPLDTTEFVFPGLAVDPSGTLIFCNPDKDQKEYTPANGFKIRSEHCVLSDRGLKCRGRIYFPSSLGAEVYAHYGEGEEFYINQNNIVVSEPKSESLVYKIAGWNVEGRDYFFDHEGLTIGRSMLTLPNTSVHINIPELKFYQDGNFKVAGASFQGFSLPFFGGRVEATEFRFSHQGLKIKAFIRLPTVLGGASIYFDNLTLHPDGRITTDLLIPKFEFDLGTCNFRFTNISLNNDGLFVGEAILTLPPELENKCLRITNLQIDAAGNFGLDTSWLAPFDLWGFRFYLSHFSLFNNVFAFSGGVVLPGHLPAGLGGKELLIEEFMITTSGEVAGFKARLDEEFTFQLAPAWELTVGNISIERDASDGFVIAIESGILHFPPILGANRVAVSGITINPVTGEFHFNKITMDGFTFNAFGLDFNFTSISINSDFDVSFSGFVHLPSGENIPEVFRGKTINVDMFEISHTGQIGNIGGSLSGLNGPLFSSLSLQNGSVGFSKTGDNLLLSLSGNILLGDTFPTGIAGTEVEISTFTLATGSWQILELQAKTSPININLFNLLSVEQAVVEISRREGESSFEVSVAGEVVLPVGLPGYFAGERVVINKFAMSTDGKINEMDILFNKQAEGVLFGNILIRNTVFSVHYNTVEDSIVYTVAGILKLGANFPPGMAGTECVINEMVFDVYGGLEKIDAVMQFPDNKLFGTLAINNGTITFYREENSGLLIGITGQIELPDFFPQGLKKLIIDISSFTIDSNGGIKDLDIHSANITTSLFGVLEVEEGAIGISANNNDEFIFDITGNLILPDVLKNILGGLDKVTITTLRLSSRSGLLDLEVKVDKRYEFEIFAGITAGFNGITISEDGISLSGDLTFPATFPQGLAGLVINLDNVSMDWSGNITNIAAGIKQININLIGFRITLDDLIVSTNGISIGDALLTLPEILGNKTMGIRNARFTRDGSFEGDFITPDLRFGIAGFELILEGPILDIDRQIISFTSTRLKTPGLMKEATLSLKNLSISRDGLNLGGIGFNLPEFSVGNGLTFSLGAEIAFDGKAYYIAGRGSAMVPGLGRLEAEVSFTNISKTYPWGLKRAYFSFNLAGPGLALGATGMFLNGIRGGLAFGPPDELPAAVRPYFKDGTRMQIGVTLVDVTCGKIVKGDVDLWVDITHWEFVVQGKVTVLNGLLSAEILAAVTNDLFYGSIRFQLRFVRGKVELWIWKDGNKARIAGQGELDFGLSRGSIVHIHRRIIKLHIPRRDWWIGGGGAFGEFKNGKKGIIGYIKVPILGRIGVFVGNGFRLGRLKGYDLDVPGRSRTLENNSGSRASSQPDSMSVMNSKMDKDEEDVPVYYYDRDNTWANQREFTFTVPGKTSDLQKIELPRNRSQSIDESAGASISKTMEEVTVEQVERIIFFIGYPEGDPVIRAISPSGIEYTRNDEGVEAEYVDEGYMLSILNPEPGQWQLHIDDLPEDVPYVIEVMGKNKNPEITVNDPAYSGVRIDNGLSVSGSVYSYTGTPPEVTIYIGTERDSFLGKPASESIVTANGNYTIPVDTSGLPEGEYFVYAQVNDGSDIPLGAYAPGSLIVDHGGRLLDAPGDVIVSRDGEDDALVVFTNMAGNRVRGFIVDVIDQETGNTRTYDIGIQTSFLVPRMREGIGYTISVVAYDVNGIKGETSEPALYIHGDAPAVFNVPHITEDSVHLTLSQGQNTETVLHYSSEFVRKTGTAQDYMDFKVKEGPLWLNLVLDDIRFVLTGSQEEIPLSVSSMPYILEDGVTVVNRPAPGEYKAILSFANMGNRELTDDVEFVIDVVPAAPVIQSIDCADHWYINDDTEITLFGENFIEGTRFFMDNTEIAPLRLSEKEATLLVKAGRATAGEHTFTVVAPGNSEASITAHAEGPDYFVEVYKSVSTTFPGTIDRFFAGIKGENDFTGEAVFSVTAAPPGITAFFEVPVIQAGNEAVLVVNTSAGTIPGTYTITAESDNGIILEFVETVSNGLTILPQISSVRPGALIPGESLIVYGNGFNDAAGRVLLGDRELTVLEWRDDRIKALTPADAQNSEIEIQTAAGTTVTGPTVYMKTAGFTIYPAQQRLEMLPGDTRDIEVMFKGVARQIELEGITETPGIDVSLSAGSVTPNASVMVTIHADNLIQNGIYKIFIHAQSAYLQTENQIEVVIGDAFELVHSNLPSAYVENDYDASIQSRNGTGRILYELTDSRLPYGLRLDEKGRITGRAQQAETVTFRIRAVDEQDHKDEASFTINVMENVWSADNKDSSRSSFIPVEGPAASLLKWSTTLNGLPGSIIAGAQRLFIKHPEGITCLEIGTGKTLYSLEGNFEKQEYSEGVLYVLDNTGEFMAFDAAYGNLLWTRSGASRFILAGNGLFLFEEQKLFVIRTINTAEIPAGTVVAIYEVTDPVDSNTILFFRGTTLYRLNQNKLQYLYTDDLSANWIDAYEHTCGLSDAAADADTIILLDEYGQILSLPGNRENNPEKEWGTVSGIVNGRLVLGNDLVFVYSTNELIAYNPALSKIVFHLFDDISRAALCNEKLFIVNNRGIKAINIYSGSTIWENDGNYMNVIISNGSVFASTSTNVLDCYSGGPNLESPVTEIILSPAAPDGNGGWYSNPVQMTINSFDPETYVESLNYSLGDDPFEIYTQAVLLPQGEYSIIAYGIDNHGYRGSDAVLNVNIDFTDPVTTSIITGTILESGWYTTPVTINLEALDNVSGVMRTDYRINNTTWHEYTRPIELSAEGIYTVWYRSIDRAGRMESIREIVLPLDFYAPVVISDTVTDEDPGIVYLAATDSSSGIAAIEYRINGSDIRIYEDPVTLSAGDFYNITYRAKDAAGLYSVWENIIVDMTQTQPARLILNLQTTKHNNHCYVNRDVKAGDRLYWGTYYPYNKIDNLPSYLEGAEMIVGMEHDRSAKEFPFYIFQAGRDMDVYIMKHENSRAILDATWNLIKQDFPVEPHRYFKGGADIYNRSFKQNEFVEIPGSNTQRMGGANLIFAAKNRGTDLKIISPHPQKEIFPLSRIWYAATYVNGETARQWFYKIIDLPGYDDWIPLGANFSGELTLPYFISDTLLVLKVEVTCLNAEHLIAAGEPEYITVSCETPYNARNKARIVITDPAPGCHVKPGIAEEFHYLVFGPDDSEIPDPDVLWTTENALIENKMIIAGKSGPVKITGTFDIAGVVEEPLNTTHIIEDTLMLNAVDEWVTEKFVFDRNLIWAYDIREDNRINGFASDYSHRLGEITYMSYSRSSRPNNRHTTEMYIALPKDGEFRYRLNNGTYRIKLRTGALQRGDADWVSFEQKIFSLSLSRKKKLYEIEALVIVEDGILNLRGAENLPLLTLDITRCDVGTAAAPDTIISRDDIYILYDKQWYVCDPGHYWHPDQYWDWNRKELIHCNKEEKRGDEKK